MMKLFTILMLAILASGCAAKSPQEFTTDKALYEHAMMLYKRSSYSDSIPFFESLRNRFSQSPYAIPSELRIADAQFATGEYLEAEINYQSFRSLHPTHEKIPYVVYRIGMCHFEGIPGGPDRDQSKTEKALQVLSELQSRWPNSEYAEKAKPLIEKCKRRLEKRELYVANFYMGKSKYEAAINRLRILGEKSEFPDLKTEALYKLAYSYNKLDQTAEAMGFLERAVAIPDQGKYTKKAKHLMQRLEAK